MYAGLSADQQPVTPGPLTQWVQALLQTPQGQAVQRDVAGAVSPFIVPAGQQAAQTWFQQNQGKLLLGGGAALLLIVWLARR